MKQAQDVLPGDRIRAFGERHLVETTSHVQARASVRQDTNTHPYVVLNLRSPLGEDRKVIYEFGQGVLMEDQ